LISNSNFKNYAEFGKGQNMKSVELENLNNFCFYKFLTSLELLKVIWESCVVAILFFPKLGLPPHACRQ
jgi:hypothetical protein